MPENTSLIIALCVISVVSATVALWLAGRRRTELPLFVMSAIALTAALTLIIGVGVTDERPEARYSFTGWAMTCFVPGAYIAALSPRRRDAGLAALACLLTSFCYFATASEFSRLAYLAGWLPDGRAFVLWQSNLLFVSLTVPYFALYRAFLSDATPLAVWSRKATLRSFVLRGALLAIGTILTLLFLSRTETLTRLNVDLFGSALRFPFTVAVFGFEMWQASNYNKLFPKEAENAE